MKLKVWQIVLVAFILGAAVIAIPVIKTHMESSSSIDFSLKCQ